MNDNIISEIIFYIINLGSGFSNGKLRIMELIKKSNKIDLIKKEYGCGGGTFKVKCSDGVFRRGHHQHDSKGILINIRNGKEIRLGWAQTIKEIEKQINQETYMSGNYVSEVVEIYEQLTLF